MKVASFEAIVRALNAAGVRYLIVGGIAVNAHGYLRTTRDVDIVVQLNALQISRAFDALASIDYHPSVPITAEEFADPSLRESWQREKGMLVLKMWSDLHRETPLDIFIYEPFDFDSEYEAAYCPESPDLPLSRFVSLPTLIALKVAAGRDRDLIDLENLYEIQKMITDENPRE